VSCMVWLTRTLAAGAPMAAMVFIFTASEGPLQAAIERAIGVKKTRKKLDVQSDAVFGTELRGCWDLRRHATRIDAPKTGKLQGRQMLNRKTRVTKGNKATGDSLSRLSKSLYRCKLKCGEKLPW